MCAINPVHKKRLVLDVYTSEQITAEEFNKRVLEASLEVEIQLNSSTRLRWHVKETEDPAD